MEFPLTINRYKATCNFMTSSIFNNNPTIGRINVFIDSTEVKDQIPLPRVLLIIKVFTMSKMIRFITRITTVLKCKRDWIDICINSDRQLRGTITRIPCRICHLSSDFIIAIS